MLILLLQVCEIRNIKSCVNFWYQDIINKSRCGGICILIRRYLYRKKSISGLQDILTVHEKYNNIFLCPARQQITRIHKIRVFQMPKMHLPV
jgi:hypothetical protein